MAQAISRSIISKRRRAPAKAGGARKVHPKIDPVFAAIEAHKAALAAFLRDASCIDDVKYPNRTHAQKRRAATKWKKLHQAEVRALKKLSVTVPSTLAGIAALVSYLADFHKNYSDFVDVAQFETIAAATRKLTVLSGSQTKPDPVFAAIDVHRAAYAAFDKAVGERNDLEDKLPESISRGALIKYRKWEIRSTEGIEEFIREKFTAGYEVVLDLLPLKPGIAMNDAMMMVQRKLMRQWNAAEKAQRLKQEKAGLWAAREREDATSDAQDRAFKLLCKVKPTTLGGLVAQVSYVRDFESKMPADQTEIADLLDSVVQTASRFAAVSEGVQ